MRVIIHLAKVLLATCLLAVSPLLLAQQIRVEGTVTDRQGAPVVGAGVVQKSVPTNGTVTNMDGQFSIRVPQGAILTVSSIGYQTQDVEAVPGMAIVLQDTVLFAGSIRENLSYAREGAGPEDLWHAVRLARCDDLIEMLPGKMDAKITSGGTLSAGERQLLSIARGFVADPRILILDEATSSVDTRTEKAVQEAIREVMSNRTSIVIAHRLSTIRDADLIVVMDAGRIVEQGTHAELMARGGRYRELYDMQFAGLDT